MTSVIKKNINELDELESQYLQKFRKIFPKLSDMHLIDLAVREAIWERDTERVKSEEIEELIIKLDLPIFVLDLFRENEKAKRFDLHESFRCPSEFFMMTKEEQDHYNVDTIKPILSDPSFYCIYAYDIKNKGFFTYDIEDSININGERYNWDGLFVHDIVNWWWYSELSNDKIIQIGNLLGLKFIEEILKSIEEFNTVAVKDPKFLEEKIINMFNLKIQ